MSSKVAVLLLASLASLTGCASMRAAEARDAYLKESMGAYTYRQSCGALWPDVLKLLASQGYSLVGADRAVGGEPRQSAAGNFFSEGFATRETYAGGLVVATDWNRDWVRYRAEGVVVGGGCRVLFTREAQPDTDDPSTTTSSTDWDMALALLRRVDPAEAKRIEAGLPAGAPKGG
jgi:hypothetical protein